MLRRGLPFLRRVRQFVIGGESEPPRPLGSRRILLESLIQTGFGVGPDIPEPDQLLASGIRNGSKMQLRLREQQTVKLIRQFIDDADVAGPTMGEVQQPVSRGQIQQAAPQALERVGRERTSGRIVHRRSLSAIESVGAMSPSFPSPSPAKRSGSNQSVGTDLVNWSRATVPIEPL